MNSGPLYDSSKEKKNGKSETVEEDGCRKEGVAVGYAALNGRRRWEECLKGFITLKKKGTVLESRCERKETNPARLSKIKTSSGGWGGKKKKKPSEERSGGSNGRERYSTTNQTRRRNIFVTG